MSESDVTADVTTKMIQDWMIFTGKPDAKSRLHMLGGAPPWRPSRGEVPDSNSITPPPPTRKEANSNRGTTFRAEGTAINLVNAALHLRRPLLITGKPGTGKSSLIYAVAQELGLGSVLRWSVTSRSVLQHGLYQYDAIGRFHAKERTGADQSVGEFITLGPLGTALLPSKEPRALLIDEIDKSDIDLPNDLLNIFEEGEFFIPELQRLPPDTTEKVTTDDGAKFPVTDGHVRCHEFPFVVLTSNGEREFPPPFLRRCIRLDMPEPGDKELREIVRMHLGPELTKQADDIITNFLSRKSKATLATDQLLNAVSFVQGSNIQGTARTQFLDVLLRALSGTTTAAVTPTAESTP